MSWPNELNGKLIKEIVFLKSKAYAFIVNETETIRCKGILKATIKKQLKFEHFNNCLVDSEQKYNQQNIFKHEHQTIYNTLINKKSLNPFDNKRYICNGGIRTLPHCSEETRLRLFHV